jgi:hypothetical protein
MKFIPLLFFCFYNYSLLAQLTSCDGTRYLNEVFGKTKVSTVTFGRNASVLGDSLNLNMDIYEPDGDNSVIRPAIILAFGGAYVFGDRSQLSDLGHYFARHGYVAACIDYRIWPVFVLGFPDSAAIVDVAMKALSDMKASIRYLRSQSEKYKVDTNLIFGGGISAGAITAIQTAYLDASDSIPVFLKTVMDKNGGFNGNSNNTTLAHSSRLAGVLNLSGGIFNTDWFDIGEPPITSIHGTADVTVPYLFGKAGGYISIFGSGAMHPVMKQKKIKETLITVPGGMHTDIYFEDRFKPYVDSFRTVAKVQMNEIICKQIVSANKDKSSLHHVKMYPNPTTDHIYIDADEKIVHCKMMDLMGRSISITKDQNRISWSARLTPGVYAIEIVLQDRSKVYSKIIVQ